MTTLPSHLIKLFSGLEFLSNAGILNKDSSKEGMGQIQTFKLSIFKNKLNIGYFFQYHYFFIEKVDYPNNKLEHFLEAIMNLINQFYQNLCHYMNLPI